ncbi:restriction endonuclease subunit S [Vibrio splendidus]|uniref:restriction endonuclease subunit S n=1 Tax=Vibrio splendidus TaxID=29497 RepID=UPI000D380DAC|nr:restriction endonuclease subunit S [Vibrio splendidus]PTQ10464.1 restriction endonuclease subunit S [Vibrio splendidus]
MSFKTYTLGEIASNTSRRFNFVGNEQVCFINTGDILDGHFLTDERVQSKGLPGQAKKAIQHGDILYSEIRPGNKRHLLVEGDVDDYVVSTKFMVITCDHDVVLPEFLYLVLTSKECEAEFKVIADSRSGTFPQITFDAVAYYPIELPSLNEQRKIVEIIKSITQKLNVNKDINSTSEDIAQALFKSWFVDFDPVKAKMNGEKPEGMDAATASLFPEKLVESELGFIPEGWEVDSLSSVVDVIMGQSPKGTTYNDQNVGTPLVNGPVEFGVYHPVAQKWTTAPTKLSKDKDLIVCVRGSTTGRYVVSDGEYCLGRGVCSVRSDDYPAFANYLFKSQLNNLLILTTGSTFPSWSGPTLKHFKVVVPPKSIIEKYEAIVGNLCSMMAQNTGENESLASLRDTLLPKLLSGEIELAPQGSQ